MAGEELEPVADPAAGHAMAQRQSSGDGNMEPMLILLAILVVAVLGGAYSVAAAAFLGGVPVGPLITSGILAVVARLIVRG